MENQNESNNHSEQGKNPANLNDHPQNASGKPGKELSSDQNKPEFDQSSESASHLNQPQGTHQQLNQAGTPKNESVQSGKRGLEQNDHTYEGENDVTHAPEKTGDPKSQNKTSQDDLRGPSKFTDESKDKGAKAGYNQAEHDKTPEANAKNVNASDPRQSDEPRKGNL